MDDPYENLEAKSAGTTTNGQPLCDKFCPKNWMARMCIVVFCLTVIFVVIITFVVIDKGDKEDQVMEEQ